VREKTEKEIGRPPNPIIEGPIYHVAFKIINPDPYPLREEGGALPRDCSFIEIDFGDIFVGKD